MLGRTLVASFTRAALARGNRLLQVLQFIGYFCSAIVFCISSPGARLLNWTSLQTPSKMRQQVESREEGHRLLAEIEANERREPIKGTFKEYGEWWLANCATGNIKDSTYEKV